MDSVVAEIAIEAMSKAPALSMAVLILILGYATVVKLMPHISDLLEAQRSTTLERERRKKDESLRRSSLEGQWLTTMQQSNCLIDQSNELSSRLVAKLDKDAEQSERVVQSLNEVKHDMNEVKHDITIIKERIK